MTTRTQQRLASLERQAEAQAPVLPTVVILLDLDGTAHVDGKSYLSEEIARAENPSPSGKYVIARTRDCRLPQ